MDNELIARVLIFGALAVCILNELFQFARGKATERWQPCEAKVLSTGTKTYRSEVGPNEHKPTIRYEYRYGGKRYTGRRVKYGNIWTERLSRPKVHLVGVNNGDELQVFVNPDQPRQSVLYRGYEGNIVWNLSLLGIVLLIFLVAA